MMKSLKIILWEEEIGRLAWDERRHLSYFTYNPDFIRKGLNISPLVDLLMVPEGCCLFGVKMPRFTRSFRHLSQIHCLMPGVTNCLIYGVNSKKYPIQR